MTIYFLAFKNTQSNLFQIFTSHIITFFVRYQKLEEQRIAKEHEFRMKQINLEKEMRKEEREHEFRMMQLLMGQQAYSNVPLPNPLPFNMPVSVALNSSPTSPTTPQIFNNGDTTGTSFSMYPSGSETQTYYKL